MQLELTSKDDFVDGDDGEDCGEDCSQEDQCVCIEKRFLVQGGNKPWQMTTRYPLATWSLATWSKGCRF